LLNQLLTLRAWRAEHPGERIPLVSFISLMSFLMWGIASLGMAIEVIVFILPWTFGWVQGTDPLLDRTLFWFTGHPIVYFWLLPAYVSWYMMIPKQVGGRLFSDGVVRAVFILFLLLSTPVGLHHQFTDPGIDEGLKFLHMAFTFAVFFPSMVTAFTIIGAMEDGAKRRGGTGLLRWVSKLPWSDPSFVAQVLAMCAFALGGATGLVNASGPVNEVVHNTSFIPGHFHLTVGTAVALSFLGISYWLIPYLTGKKLWNPRLAVLQAWLWFGGVMAFSIGLMRAGVQGEPRRIPAGSVAYALDSWHVWDILTGIGGTVMFTSGVLFFVVILKTLASKATGEVYEMPLAETMTGPERAPKILDRIGVWVIVALVLIAIAYVPVFLSHVYQFNSPGFSLF
jgi:cytochrome c oxidase subunit 1